MLKKRMLCLTCIFLLICLLTVSVNADLILSPPRTTAVVLGGSAKFECKVKFVDNNYFKWEFQGHSDYLYTYQYGIEEHPPDREKYSVEFSRDHMTFTLTIKEVNFKDGGEYMCSTMVKDARAELIVLGTPFITINASNNEEGNIAEYTCKGKFGGLKNVSADLRMSLDGTPLTNTTRYTTEEYKEHFLLQQKLQVTLNPNLNGKIIKCEMVTLTSKLSTEGSAKINALYSICTISVSPRKENYEFGNSLKCTADGNPSPYIDWEDLQSPNDRVKPIEGGILNVTTAMVGRNKWRCTAMNTINGRLYRNSTLVIFTVLDSKQSSDETWKVAVPVTIFFLIIVVAVVLFKVRGKYATSLSDKVKSEVTEKWLSRETIQKSETQFPQRGKIRYLCAEDDKIILAKIVRDVKEKFKQEVLPFHDDPTFTHLIAPISARALGDHSYMLSLRKALDQFHYGGLPSMVVLVIVDKEMKETGLDLNLRIFNIIPYCPDEKQRHQICAKLKVLPTRMYNNIWLGNAGIVLAWSYYFNYLTCMLPGLQEWIKTSKTKVPDKSIASKFIIVIPESSSTKKKLTEVDQTITSAQLVSLDENTDAETTDEPKQDYETFLHRIIYGQEEAINAKPQRIALLEELYFYGVLVDMRESFNSLYDYSMCDLDEKELSEQLVLFKHTLSSIVGEKCDDSVFVYGYGDSTGPLSLAGKIHCMISGENKRLQNAEDQSSSAVGYSPKSQLALFCVGNKDMEKWSTIVKNACEGCFTVKTHTTLTELISNKNNFSPDGEKDTSDENCAKFAKHVVILSQSSRREINNNSELLMMNEFFIPRTAFIIDLPETENIPDWLEKSGIHYICSRTYKVENISRQLQDFLGTDTKSAPLPVGNVADGLALAYYNNYLKIIGPTLADRIQKTRYFDEGSMLNKFFILLPSSCFSYPSVSDADKNITFVQKLPVAEFIDISIHKLEENGKIHYVCVEYCNPVRVLYEMTAMGKGLSEQQKEIQLCRFYKVLSEILTDRLSPRFCENIILVRYNDNEECQLSEVLKRKIQSIEKIERMKKDYYIV